MSRRFRRGYNSGVRDRTVGAILAGGSSRRMGRDKAELPFGGRPLICRPASALAAVTAEWVVVGGSRRKSEALGVPTIPDSAPDVGPLAGLLAALEHASGRPVLVVACDLPFVEPRLLSELVQRGESSGCDAVVPVEESRRQPLCAWYSPACRGRLREAIRAGDRGVLQFVDALESDLLALPQPPAGSLGQLMNVNSPDDYERALAQLERSTAAR